LLRPVEAIRFGETDCSSETAMVDSEAERWLEAALGIAAGSILDGKFRIVRLVGEGGMGAVYEAEHTVLRRRVAVKFLSGELAHNADAIGRFRREAEAAGRIGHDNICEVFDFGVTEQGSPYFVMPLLKGEALSAVIRRESPLPVDRAIDVVRQMLKALAAAHGVGIIHRDLKPDNVFLTTVGDREDFVKLLDFGISKMLRDPTAGGPGAGAGPGHPPTQTGYIMGTPSYMSSEQARSAKDIDARADIYAVGVILYEMLTGIRAFDGENFGEIVWKIYSEPVRPLRAHRPDISPELEAVVLRAMHRDRDQRFPTCEAFREALAEATGRTTGTHRIPQTVATMQADGAEAGAPRIPPRAPTTARTPHQGTLAEVTEYRVPRSRAGLWVGLAGGAVLALGLVLFLALRDGSDTPAAPTAKPPGRTTVARATDSSADRSAGAEADAKVEAPTDGSAATPADPTAAATGGTSGAGSDAGAAGPDAGPEPTLPPPPSQVTITLEGLPPGTHVRVDGVPVDSPTFQAPRSDSAKLTVAVRADGYRPLDLEVAADTSATIPIRLEPLADGADAGPRPRDAGTATRRDAGATAAADADAVRRDAGVTAAADTAVARPVDAGTARRDARGPIEGTVGWDDPI
jgi:serine/threonine-protein kinase